jgi:anhydro-N-acetylmuramic acid kinase
MSGTSVDGVDAVVAEITAQDFAIRSSATRPYPQALRRRVTALIESPAPALRELGRIDAAVGHFFAECALDAVAAAGLEPSQIEAIGHHGQTVYHDPVPPEPFTMQIGDPNVIAARTGITTVADFRRLDIALGGQGAPLVCAFHSWRFGHAAEARAVVNIGGIANVTLLVPGTPPLGFDTGPGNTVLDRWIERHLSLPFDRGGAWAAGGTADEALLARLLTEPYFAAPAPKSTGRELFNAAWLDAHLDAHRTALGRTPAPEDVQATLAELTARTIAGGLRTAAPDTAPLAAELDTGVRAAELDEADAAARHSNAALRAPHESDSRRLDRLIVCGGGAYNVDLIARLSRAAAMPVESSGAYGIAPDWVEASAFAWLAYARLHGEPGNVPSVTGAREAAVLGSVYCGASPHGRARCFRRGHGYSEPQAT